MSPRLSRRASSAARSAAEVSAVRIVCGLIAPRCAPAGARLLPRPPGRCRILPGKLPVRGLPGAKRRDAKAAGRSALDWELSRRQDRPAREDGPVALAGTV